MSFFVNFFPLNGHIQDVRFRRNLLCHTRRTTDWSLNERMFIKSMSMAFIVHFDTSSPLNYAQMCLTEPPIYLVAWPMTKWLQNTNVVVFVLICDKNGWIWLKMIARVPFRNRVDKFVWIYLKQIAACCYCHLRNWIIKLISKENVYKQHFIVLYIGTICWAVGHP